MGYSLNLSSGSTKLREHVTLLAVKLSIMDRLHDWFYRHLLGFDGKIIPNPPTKSVACSLSLVPSLGTLYLIPI